VALEIATRVTTPTVGAIFEVEEYLGARCFRAKEVSIDVGN
jgi:hypothetical protein